MGNCVAVGRPINQAPPHFALARAVVQIAVLDGLGTAHFVDPHIAIYNRTMGEAPVERVTCRTAAQLAAAMARRGIAEEIAERGLSRLGDVGLIE